MRGKITFWNDDRGVGVIASGRRDLAFHITSLESGVSPSRGDVADFQINIDPRTGKEHAVEVRVLEKSADA